MPDDPQADLIDAILSLDAYNRGYGSGINALDVPNFDQDGNPTNQVQLGDFSIIRQSNTQPTSEAFKAGFYGIAYQDGNQIVVSFRGTDRNGIVPTVDPNRGGSDPLNGYVSCSACRVREASPLALKPCVRAAARGQA